MVSRFVKKKFSDNTRVRIFFFPPEFNIRLYGKNSESDYFFFPPPKSEYFFITFKSSREIKMKLVD